MRAVKYWKVDLFNDTGFRAATSLIGNITGAQIPQSPFFTGYTLRMPDFNVADDELIEIRMSVDDVAVYQVRRSLIGSVRVTPIYIEEPTEEKVCDEERKVDDLAPPGFEDAARPLMKWLAENVHPHHTAIVDQSSAELLMGIQRAVTQEYIKD